MDELHVAIEVGANPHDVAFVRDQLDAYNVAITGCDDYCPLAIFVRDAQGAVVGGLTGFTWGRCLKIDILWVKEEWRHRGYGARLIAVAEAEARAHGCQHAVLETHSFQAPAFYRRRGYAVCGAYEGYPAGHAKYFLKKAIRPVAVAD